MKRVIGKSQVTVEAILERKYMLIICEIMGNMFLNYESQDIYLKQNSFY